MTSVQLPDLRKKWVQSGLPRALLHHLVSDWGLHSQWLMMFRIHHLWITYISIYRIISWNTKSRLFNNQSECSGINFSNSSQVIDAHRLIRMIHHPVATSCVIMALEGTTICICIYGAIQRLQFMTAKEWNYSEFQWRKIAILLKHVYKGTLCTNKWGTLIMINVPHLHCEHINGAHWSWSMCPIYLCTMCPRTHTQAIVLFFHHWSPL